jgi:murein DD-endopeptidase MepM/ murein hydrolase activator NlpD
MHHRIISCILAVLLLGLPLTVYGHAGHEPLEVGGTTEEIESINDEISAQKDRVKELEQTISEYRRRIASIQTEAVSLENQIALLDNRIAQVEVDLELTQAKIAELQLKIAQLILEIDQREQDITYQKEILAEFLRTMYFEGQDSFVEILASHDSFSEFYNHLQYLDTVEQDISQSARALETAKADLQQKQSRAEAAQESYETLEISLAAKKEELDEQLFLKTDLLAKTQSSELTFKTMVNNLRQQYRTIESDIASKEQEIRRKLEEADKLAQIDDAILDANGSFILSWPTQSRYVTASFHDADYPYKHVFEHSGMDVRSAQGSPLKAAAAGFVARARTCDLASCYAYVMIVHSGGYATVYGHMSRIDVTEDQFVTRGEVIGLSGGMPGTVGAGPFVTGPHLHFELRKDGIPIDPFPYMIKDY